MITPYEIPTTPRPIELDLSRNEGSPWFLESREAIEDLTGLANRYPTTSGLSSAIAERHSIDDRQVLVTAGGDDALFRCFLARAGCDVVTTTPTFEMIGKYSAQSACTVSEISWWDGPFPIEDFAVAAAESDLSVVVSPNNPTGHVITSPDLRRLSAASPLVVLDSAYAEFADEDLTPLALELGNVVVIRTMSKAFGLAGLRVGYLIGPSHLIAEVSAFGSPYPVSGVSAHLAELAMRSEPAPREQFVDQVRLERSQLEDLLARLGAPALKSQANFVLASSVDPPWITAAAGALGIALRSFPGRLQLTDSVRITLPGRPAEFEKLTSVLRTVMSPDCLLFDLDGVIADVSLSYRKAIVATAAFYGIAVSDSQISQAKAQGNANDDWALTAQLCRNAGVVIDIDELTARFEAFYQGTDRQPGLNSYETPLVATELLALWKAGYRLGIVTGRPRKDALAFLERFGLLEYFDSVVTREDAPLKPDPGPVLLAMRKLDATHGWMLGDTPDDLTAARLADVLPIGVVAPGQDPGPARQTLSGAAIVLDSTSQLEELLNATHR